ncbi:GNAT family N-acetyltransferase [Pseudonocardia sp. CA-107938]|uniref:GNAT family N-acetyltransferase n=1 Tax=Pseudonocardia sp. CA-107938 TaxID=3240021 RepID=UPI003D8B063D
MLPPDLFRDQPVQIGERVRLEPLTEAVLVDYLAMLADPELGRLTGSAEQHAPERIREWLATRAAQVDRVDWAAIRIADGAFLGEAVLNQYDPANAWCNFRIALAAGHLGQGYGTEITRLTLDHGFAAGLHRISLTVFAFNPRARRVYEKCGFRVEGRSREVLWWDGGWHDEYVMGVLATDPR